MHLHGETAPVHSMAAWKGGFWVGVQGQSTEAGGGGGQLEEQQQETQGR